MKTQNPTLALWSLLLLLMASLTAHAQRQVDLLAVRVVNADGSPAANVRVLIESDTCGRELPYSRARSTDARGMALDTVPAIRCNRPARYRVTIIDCKGDRIRQEVIIGRTPMPVHFVYCRSNPDPARCKAEFAIRPANNAGNAFSFVDQSRGENLQYFWDFGDGNRSNEANPTHTYARPGAYRVCLTVVSRQPNTPNACADTTCQVVNVPPQPARCKAEFAIRPTDVVDRFSFVDQSRGENLQYFWDFGDGNRSNESNPTHAYARSGAYRVCLTVVSRQPNTPNACADTTCQVVNVPPQPARCKAKFEIREQGLSFAFVNRSEPSNANLRYNWSFGDGNGSSEENPTHTYARPGRYEVCLTIATPEGCTSTKCEWVSATDTTPQPKHCKAAFTLRPANNAGNAFNFVDQSRGENLQYFWDFGDGNRSNEANPTHTYARAGAYRVCLTVVSRSSNPNTTCSDSTCQTITVQPQPARCKAEFEVRPRNTGFAFVNRSQPANARMQYVWSFGDGNRSTATNPTHTYARGGRYEVCLTVTAPDGCTDTRCQWVSAPNPAADTTLTSICFNVRLSDGRTPADSYTIILYRLNANNRWVPVDTLLGPPANTSEPTVCFTNLPKGQYIALGQLTPRSQHRASHIPTYYDRSRSWRNARIIDTRQAYLTVVHELVLLPRLRTGGPARAAGRAAAPGKTGSVGLGAWVIALDAVTGEAVALTETAADGSYALEGLPYGTYRLVAEAINLHDRPLTIVLSPEIATAEADITLSEEPAPASRGQLLSFGDLTLYPNPSTGLVWLKAPWLTGEAVEITVLGTDGRVLRQHRAPATEAIDLSDLPQGLYLLRVVQGLNAATRSLLLN